MAVGTDFGIFKPVASGLTIRRSLTRDSGHQGVYRVESAEHNCYGISCLDIFKEEYIYTAAKLRA